MNKMLLTGIIMIIVGLSILSPGIRNANEYLQFQKDNFPSALREYMGFKEIFPLALGGFLIIAGSIVLIIKKRKNY